MAPRCLARPGFTLLEVMVVMLVMTILLAGIAVPIGAQVAMRRQEETRLLLVEAREAILGFAATNGRLPCPATADSRGQESFAPGGDALNGNCSRFHDGFLPAATLGLSPLDEKGFARDGWGTEANRIRYAVFGSGRSVGGVANPLTRANGMRQATLTARPSRYSGRVWSKLLQPWWAQAGRSTSRAVPASTRRRFMGCLLKQVSRVGDPAAADDDRHPQPQ